MHRCRVCRRAASPTEGVYLALLFPAEFMCSGCGRRERHCSCRAT
jgi:hypothetical protein